jgi:hypothetical protein
MFRSHLYGAQSKETKTLMDNRGLVASAQSNKKCANILSNTLYTRFPSTRKECWTYPTNLYSSLLAFGIPHSSLQTMYSFPFSLSVLSVLVLSSLTYVVPHVSLFGPCIYSHMQWTITYLICIHCGRDIPVCTRKD